MVRRAKPSEADFEDFLAELTDTAYRAALRHGLRGSFLDTQLALWRELRGVLRSKWDANSERRGESESWSTGWEPSESSRAGAEGAPFTIALERKIHP
jgi:hypothetical protein